MAEEKRNDEKKMADDELRKEIQKLATAVDGLRKNLEKGKKKEPDSDLALLTALMPLCGMTPFFGASLFFPFGLRFAMARALMLNRALDRAATISKALTKGCDDADCTSEEMVQQFFKGIAGISDDQRQILATILRNAFCKKE
jgi:hypothetical protein